MTAIPGSVRVAGFIAPTDSTDTYAVHDDAYGRGGWRTVANITERNSISADRRKVGMAVRVLDSGGFQKFYTLSGGIDNANWIEDSFGGGGGGSIDIDTTYYVDGDNGSDAYTGLSWGAAKKTMAFLYSLDEDAIPREINAVVTIRTRGTILSKDTTRHTTVDLFYGSGIIEILGETEDVITGLVPTGFDNTSSSVTYRSYVEVDSATWSVDEYQGMFIQITNPSTDTICPIISNTSTRIETTGLSISGANTFKIIKNLTSFRAATVLDPTTIVVYSDYYLISTLNISIPFKISGVNTYDCGMNISAFSTLAGEATTVIFSFYQNGLYITGCNIGFTYLGSTYPVLENSYGSGIWFLSEANKLWIDRCVFVGTGAEYSCPIYLYYPCMAFINHTRITNFDIGIYSENAITLQMVNNLVELCNIGFNLNSSVVDMANSGFNRFKNNVTCINLSKSTFKIFSPSAGFYGSGNTSEIVIADTPHSVTYSFSDIAAKRQIYNARSGGSIVYVEGESFGFKEETFVEYDNTASGLDSYFYQGAIDILATRSIEQDITYYVDGDNGNDLSSGLSWGAAKKTMSFLYSGDGYAISREIKAIVTVNIRGTVLSADNTRHTIIDKLYGSGELHLVGQTTDIVTNLTPTGWGNGQELEFHTFVDVSGVTWTTDEYQGCFIQFTTPASPTLYPIQNNTTTRLESTDLPEIDGTYRFKIVSVPKLRGATVADPTTLIDYSAGNFAEEILVVCGNKCHIDIRNLSITEHAIYYPIIVFGDSVGESIDWDLEDTGYNRYHVKFVSIVWRRLFMGNEGRIGVIRCLCLPNSSLTAAEGTYGISSCSFTSNAPDYSGLTVTSVGKIFVTNCRFSGCRTAVGSGGDGISFLRLNWGNYFENCTYAIAPSYTTIGYDGRNWLYGSTPIRYKNCGECIRLIGNQLVVRHGLQVFNAIENCTKEIVISDVDGVTTEVTFADVAAKRNISNAASGASVKHIDLNKYYLPVGAPEYDGAASGLDAYSYQEAIDILAVRSIEQDITYYVDGDNGSDAYTGFSWATAKKTMAFLYSGDGYAIPRELNAVVTVRTRGTILSKTTDRHTVIDGLYGSGHLKILGETQDVVTGLVPTGWDNTESSVTYKSYLDVGTATWTVDEYQGMFIQFTSPASTDLFPIMSNTATRLETIGLPVLAGTETFKIINNLTIIKAASVSDPSSIIEYYPFEFFKIESIVSELNNIDCSTLMGATYGNSIKLYSMVNSPGYDAILAGYKPKTKGCILNNVYLGHDTFIFESCLIKGSNPYISVVSGIGRFEFIQCGFYGISALELPAILAYTPGFVNISSVRIKNYDVGVYAEHGTTLSVFNVLIEGCNIGLNLNKTVVDAYSQFVRFKNNVVCINLSGTTFKVDSPTSGFLGSGNTYDIVVGNKPYISSYNFSDVVARNKIYNVKSGGQIIYYEVGSDIKEETFVEYDNTTSLLDAYNYQDAIDLLAASTGSGAVKTIFSDLAISLTDAYNFILTESIAATDEAIVYLFESTPTVGVGFIIISFYKDAARTQKVHEISIDLADAVSWNSSEAFGIQTDTTGTIYGKINCSELSPGSTINISLYANSISPTITPIPMPGPYGDGLEDNGFGDPQIALAPNSGLEFLSGELRIKSDVTTPATVSIGVGGTSVTGVVNLTTDQTVAGQKLFDSCGLIPTDSYGPPTGGGWINGVEALDGYGVKWRYFQNSWELADVVTEYPEIIAGTTLAYGGMELFKIPVTGDVGQCLWLRVWARRATGTAEIQIPFRVRIFETSDARGREMVWQGLGLARQTYLDVSLPASQTYIEVNSNDIIDVDELICIYENDSRFEIGRCSARPTGQITLSESLVDGNTWDVNTLAIPVTEWWNVPWINRDGDSSDQKHILLQVRHDGLSTDPSLVFYVQVLAQSRGIIR